ncbi:MAG: biopolymer transporter ExbD, partial [Phycisphaeraceae bacterium]|nr:biopolymer transporter ExbD [Phycisphaeraceae bacterium]
IFLLLTFFIYSLIVMVRAEVLPVQLVTLQGGERAQAQPVRAITIDPQGQLFLDRQPLAKDDLADTLAEIAAMPDAPTLYLAMSSAGDVDRGPTLLRLIEAVRTAGIEDFVIVGQPLSPESGDGS